MSKTIRASCYLTVVGRKSHAYGGWDLSIGRLVKRTGALPPCAANEVPIRVDIELPVALFERPELSVAIKVAGDTPRVEIDADTQENLAQRMQEIIGLPVTISVDLPETQDDIYTQENHS